MRLLAPSLLSLSPVRGLLLFLESNGLDVGEVLAGALPLRVQDEALIMFGLGKNTSPRVQKG